jgi:hypothetical protein
MSGRNVQRKLGTTRGSPRRSRTAKASRISRRAVKSRCAREWGGWGRLSDDGPGHYNPDPSEGPWGRWSIPPHGGAVIASTDPTLCGSTLKHEGRRQTGRRSAYAGSRLKLIDASGRSRLTRQPFSRTEGKPAVRNVRGDRGNVGIIRSPVRATILPDHLGDGGRSSWRPVVGEVPTTVAPGPHGQPTPRTPVRGNSPRTTAEGSGCRTDGLRTSPVGTAGAVGPARWRWASWWGRP